MPAVLFKDLYKPFKDFNTKNFNGSTSNVELKASSAAGSSAKFKGVINGDKTTGELECAFPIDNPVPHEVKCKFTCDGSLELTPTFKNLIPNAVIEACFAISKFHPTDLFDPKKWMGVNPKLTCHYTGKTFNTSVVASSLLSSPSVDLAAVFERGPLLFGLQSLLCMPSATVCPFGGASLAFRYAAKDFSFGGSFVRQGVTLGWLRPLENLTVGGEVKMEFHDASASEIALGGEKALSPCSKAKVRLSSKGALKIAVSHTIANGVEATGHGNVGLAGSSGANSFGISFEFDEAKISPM